MWLSIIILELLYILRNHWAFINLTRRIIPIIQSKKGGEMETRSASSLINLFKLNMLVRNKLLLSLAFTFSVAQAAICSQNTVLCFYS